MGRDHESINHACLALAALGLTTLFAACTAETPPEPLAVGSNPDLAAHSAEFKQEVIEVSDGVHVAVGFGLANSVLLEGDDGVVIVDTMESVAAAVAVKAAFNRISAKPVKAIIYTHYHPDHILGAEIMAGDDSPDVYSHADTSRYMQRIATITRETTHRRGMRQFGTLLPAGGLINAGIGPRLENDGTNAIAPLKPTRTFSEDRLELEIAGLKLVLVYAPGETPDQIFIWMPENKVLLPADNFYKSFPNLYAIRGTAYRDVRRWVDSIDKMRELNPEHLVSQHTRPVSGAREIYRILTDYRDAIQFVHDQTVRWMNRGLTPMEIVERVKLPPHLARKPHLHEYYGTVPWSVRAIFDGYLGWFGGNATDLFPLPLKERARRFADLAGGEQALLERAGQAVADEDYQWALELTDQLLQLDPDSVEVRKLRASALKALGSRQVAATARNYYLTQALETEGRLRIGSLKVPHKSLLKKLQVADIFNAMMVNLVAEKSLDVDTVAGFRFPDTGEAFSVHVRRGVAEVRPRFPEDPDISLTVDSTVWKEVVTGFRNPALALVKDVDKEGGMVEIVKFLNLFKDDQ